MTDARVKEIRRYRDWLDEQAALISNIGKPRSDNNYGRAAQAIDDLLAKLDEARARVAELEKNDSLTTNANRQDADKGYP